MVDSYLKGDTETARKLQLKYLDLVSALFCETSPIPVKEAMNQMGFNVGVCRLPLVEASENAKQKVNKELKALGLI